MTWRSAHGRAAELGRLTVLETVPSDELRPASPSDAVRPQRDPSGRFLPGNRAGTAKRLRAGKRGALAELEGKGDAAARAALAFGRRYAAHRRAELAQAHGGELSAGVGAMVESAGELLAAARYWSARGIAEASPDHARLAATLVAGARQAERDAWELASREAKARPQAHAFPWLTAAAQSAPDDDDDAEPVQPAADAPAPEADADVDPEEPAP